MTVWSNKSTTSTTDWSLDDPSLNTGWSIKTGNGETSSFGSTDNLPVNTGTYDSTASAVSGIIGGTYHLFDDRKFLFGTDSDITMKYNSSADNLLIEGDVDINGALGLDNLAVADIVTADFITTTLKANGTSVYLGYSKDSDAQVNGGGLYLGRGEFGQVMHKISYLSDGDYWSLSDDLDGPENFEISTNGSIGLTLKNGELANDQWALFGDGSDEARISSNGDKDLYLFTNEGDVEGISPDPTSGYIHLQADINGDISIIPHGEGATILGSEDGVIQFVSTEFVDGNGNPLFDVHGVSDAKNRLSIKSAISGSSPIMEPYSTEDTNVDLEIRGQGTGVVDITSAMNVLLPTSTYNPATKGYVDLGFGFKQNLITDTLTFEETETTKIVNDGTYMYYQSDDNAPYWVWSQGGVSPMGDWRMVLNENPTTTTWSLYSPTSAVDYINLKVGADSVTTLTTGDFTLDGNDILLNCDAGGDILITEDDGVYTPTEGNHVATKGYVDSSIPIVPLIQDSISDLVLNGATQNAIYDALLLKANAIHMHSELFNLADDETITGTPTFEDGINMTGNRYLDFDGTARIEGLDRLGFADGSTMSGMVDDFANADATKAIDSATIKAEIASVSAPPLQDDDTFASPAATKTASSESIKAYVDANVGGGGGTDTWAFTCGGYKTNNNSASNYYYQYYINYHSWTAYDTTPTSLGGSGTSAKDWQWKAPAAGELTNIWASCRTYDTGATDPFRFYVYKGVPATDATNTSLTVIGISDIITPSASNKITVVDTDISALNLFSADDCIWVMIKKDSTTGNQDQYFSIRLSGEYT